MSTNFRKMQFSGLDKRQARRARRRLAQGTRLWWCRKGHGPTDWDYYQSPKYYR